MTENNDFFRDRERHKKIKREGNIKLRKYWEEKRKKQEEERLRSISNNF